MPDVENDDEAKNIKVTTLGKVFHSFTILVNSN